MAVEEFVSISPKGTDPEQLTDAFGTVVLEALDPAFAEELPAESQQVLEAGSPGELRVETVARILAHHDDRDPEFVHADLLDRILLEMTNAVVDVDALASRLGLAMTAKEIQRRIEGREPMRLAEYATIRHAIAND